VTVFAIIRELRLGVLAAAALLLSACQQPQATTTALPASMRPDGTYVDPATSLAFPVTLGSYRRTEIREQTKGGISVGYEGTAPLQGVFATISVYPVPWRGDMPATTLTGRQFSSVCRSEFERIKQRMNADDPTAHYADERGFVDVNRNGYAGSTRLVYRVDPKDGVPGKTLSIYVTCLGERGWIIRADLRQAGSVDLDAAYHALRDDLMSHSSGVRGYGWDGAPNTI